MNVFDLCWPIILSGIAVHIASTLAWVVLPHHKPEWLRLPMGPLDDALPAAGAEVGKQYVLIESGADPNDMNAACKGSLILWRKSPNMGKNIALTVTYFLCISAVIGYLASISMTAATPKLDVFRFTATCALLCYSFGGMSHVIWFRRRVLLDMIDGLVYSLITGGIFMALWPTI